MSQPSQDEIDDEFRLFTIRYMQFRNIWTLYWDFASGRYVPSEPGYESELADWRTLAEFQPTLMFLLYSFFYSLVDEHPKGTNAFRSWRAKFPDQEAAISAVEFRVSPIRDDLKTFRHRLGFHGSRTSSHQTGGLDLFGAHSGTKMINVMKQFKAMTACLLALDMSSKRCDHDGVQQAQTRIDEIAARCRADSGADFESNDLPPIGV